MSPKKTKRKKIKREYDVGKGIAAGLLVLERVLEDCRFWVMTPHYLV
jgi:hypothetical protein